MKKMKREMQPMVFRSFRTPGLKGQRAMGRCEERKQKRMEKDRKQIRGDVTGVGREKDSDKEHFIRNSDCNQESVAGGT